MQIVAFWLYTIVVGTVFTFALLWVIAEWLKSTEDKEQMDARLREVIQEVAESARKAA